MTPPTQPRAVVLLEGVSDVAAVRRMADAGRVDLGPVRLVNLRGITNIRRVLTAARGRWPQADVLGMYDAGEARFVVRALDAVGVAARYTDDLASYGFFVCRTDLEDELIRALGTARTLEVVDRLGLRPKLAALVQQPAWQGRPLADQLHRFCGVASGRKELLAGELAAALVPGREPEPLRRLLERLGGEP